eukprot:jgi/Tetstr1/453995/TSEL_040914.t1
MATAVRIDSREAALAAALPEAARVSLGTGDIEVGDAVVLERKTVPDLAASVRDGRWRDQLARLRAAPRAALVIEGPLPRGDERVNGMSGASMRSALVGAFVRDGVAHFLTEDVEGTADLVRAMAARVARGEAPSSQGTCGARLPRRGDALQSSRAIALAQMCVVPGVSMAVAETVLGDCRTLGEWARAWTGRADDLADIKVKSRRVGPVVAARLLAACGALPPEDRYSDQTAPPAVAGGADPNPARARPGHTAARHRHASKHDHGTTRSPARDT